MNESTNGGKTRSKECVHQNGQLGDFGSPCREDVWQVFNLIAGEIGTKLVHLGEQSWTGSRHRVDCLFCFSYDPRGAGIPRILQIPLAVAFLIAVCLGQARVIEFSDSPKRHDGFRDG